MGGDIESGGRMGAGDGRHSLNIDEAGTSSAVPSGCLKDVLASMLGLCGAEVFAFDRAGRLALMNSAVDQSRFKPDSLLRDVFPGPLAEVRLAAAAELFASGKSGVLEIDALLEGKTVRFEDRMMPYFMPSGEVGLVMVASHVVGPSELGGECLAYLPSADLKVVSCGWLEGAASPRPLQTAGRPDAAYPGAGLRPLWEGRKLHGGAEVDFKKLPEKNAQEELEGVVNVTMDMDGWRTLDEQIRLAKAKAEELARVKSEFLACISHEIRTPLNAIVGMSELLKEVTPPNSEVANYCEEIERASEMLLTILNDILDYALLESGDVKLFSQDFDFREEVESVVDSIRGKAEEKGLVFHFEMADDVPHAVCGDPRHLRRALSNLLDNAIKFTASGKVGLKVFNLGRCGASDGRSRLQLEVFDSGIGIAPDAMTRIFEPFTQEDSSCKRAYGGTGLGLAIVRKLVKVMGGSVDVESVKGSGSVFIVEIPFKTGLPGGDGVKGSGSRRRSGLAPMAGMKALLFDGGPSASLMKRILGTLGVEASHVATEDEARRLLSSNSFDIAFFDAEMSDHGRLRAVSKSLRESAASGHVPLVAMAASSSGHGGGDAGERDLCGDAGIDAFLSKPPRRSQVAAVLRAYGNKKP